MFRARGKVCPPPLRTVTQPGRSLVSLTASSTPNALINRAVIAIKDGRYDDAEADLNTVLSNFGAQCN